MDLVNQTVLFIGIACLAVDDLDRSDLSGRLVLGLINGAICAFAEDIIADLILLLDDPDILLDEVRGCKPKVGFSCNYSLLIKIFSGVHGYFFVACAVPQTQLWS